MTFVIKTALTFVSKCSQSMQDRAFQYKIITNILPTNEYLKRYKVRESDQCDLCNMECDTITHRLYECVQINIWVEQIFSILQTMCSQPKISMVEYLFGKPGQEHAALNHILVELKKMLFYSDKIMINSPTFKDLFMERIRALIVKEKGIFLRKKSFETFQEKWKKFVYIYDFRGPDLQG